MNTEDIIVALSIKYNGDWEDIFKTITQKRVEQNVFQLTQEEWAEKMDLQKYYEIALKSDYKYVTIISPDYPSYLRKMYTPPFVIFYHGDLSLIQSCSKNVSVVGSRECSEYGAAMTEKIVDEVSKSYTIVSGMARGIDTIAHQTAIRNGGKTIAVLGGGINYCYPASNRQLYEELKKNHLVISEYPGDVTPAPSNFPKRNRIIAYLSKATIVTEAHLKSGTSTTVTFALQEGRDVLCVPYRADEESDCNRLIKAGAYLVENVEDVMDILDYKNFI